MITLRTESPEEYERSKEAAGWYVQHESGGELSAVRCREWERWCQDERNCAEYDRIAALHIRARELPRPLLPSDDDVRADHQEAIAPSRSSDLAGALSPWGYQKWRPFVTNGLAGLMLIVMSSLATITLCRAWEGHKAVEDTVQAQWEATPYSEVMLERSRATGRPVLVDVSASWCAICVVNERFTLSRDSVRRTMVRKRIVYLKGEWSNGNNTPGAILRRFGRSGQPLYLLYRPGTKEPEILPQNLTEDIMLNALSKLPDPQDPRRDTH